MEPVRPNNTMTAMLWPLAELFLRSLQPVARVESERPLATGPCLVYTHPECQRLEAETSSGKDKVRILPRATSFCDAAGHQEHGDFRCAHEAKALSH